MPVPPVAQLEVSQHYGKTVALNTSRWTFPPVVWSADWSGRVGGVDIAVADFGARVIGARGTLSRPPAAICAMRETSPRRLSAHRLDAAGWGKPYHTLSAYENVDFFRSPLVMTKLNGSAYYRAAEQHRPPLFVTVREAVR